MNNIFYIDTDKCISCGSCAKACPSGIFRMSDGKPEIHYRGFCMQCRHCMSACPRQAISFDGIENAYPEAPTDEFERFLSSRRSIRRFKNAPPEREKLFQALSCASWAPSGKNIRSHEFTLLYGLKQTEGALRLVYEWSEKTGSSPELLKYRERGKNLVTCGAPCIIIGHNSPTTLNPSTDTVIATTYLELSLVAQGLGTCWGGYMRRAINAWPPLKEYCGISDEREAYALLMVGIPDDVHYVNTPLREPVKSDWRE